ncbi:MAG: hypothetical protein AAGJ54_11040 [Planctomycetota bacterium]
MPPVEKLQFGPVQAAIWMHVNDDGYARYGVTFERRYVDPETGEWKSSDSYNRDEALLLAKIADLANSRIFELQESERRVTARRKARVAVVPARGGAA